MSDDDVHRPAAAIAVVSMATLIALPRWRNVLNILHARPVAADVIVAKAAACTGTNTGAIARPKVSISAAPTTGSFRAPAINHVAASMREG